MLTMFREIDADVYVMLDGDGTYQGRVHALLEPVLANRADMVFSDHQPDPA